MKYVKDQTEGICLEAVKQNGLAVKYVENKTMEICVEAGKENFDALIYVKDLPEEMHEEVFLRVKGYRS